MNEKQEESMEALKNLCSYNKKLMHGIEQLVSELRGNKKSDTDEFLLQIIKGVGWNIETLNLIMPMINSQKILLDKSKVNNSIISLNQALETKDDKKVADELELSIKPLLIEQERIHRLLQRDDFDVCQDTHNLLLDNSKILWHKERLNQWEYSKGKIAPITIDCALTTKCSYRCVYCYGKMQCINQSDNLDKETIFNFLDDAAEIGVKAVSFVSDGESTCNPNLKDAIIHGKENGLDMALGTNGYLLKNEDLEEILKCLTYLRFNISAGEADRYAYIHGCSESCYYKVIDTIKQAVRIKKEKNMDVTIGMQMVLLPEFKDQILPLTKLGLELGVDYLVIKHCSDDEDGTLGVDYSKYEELVETLKEAESYSTEDYQVSAKWSKILSNGNKSYCKCFGPPFILQMSGTGLVAPCGMFFNDKYKKYHIGNIKETRFKDLWKSDKYWEIMNLLSSEEFNPQKDCGTLCLQHKTNEVLWEMYKNREIPQVSDKLPNHINFI